MFFQQGNKIGVRDIEEFQQPMFEFNIVLAVSKTQTCCSFERVPHIGRHFVDQRLQIDVNHGFIPRSSLKLLNPCDPCD